MRLTVMMPVYNGERYLAAAIEGILGQTWREFEFLICDDGSVDATPAILRQYAQKDARIRILTFAKNRGQTEAANHLLQHSRGAYICRQDADDYSQPERLARQVAYLDARPETGMVFTGKRMLAPNGLPFATICMPDDHALIAGFMARGINPIVNGSFMIRRAVLLAAGTPTYRFRAAEDWDLWQRLVGTTRFGTIPEPLYDMRYYGGTVSFKIRTLERSMLTAMGNSQDPNTAHSVTAMADRLDQAIVGTPQKPPPPATGYESYLNGQALFKHGRFREALLAFTAALTDAEYRRKAFLFAGLSLLGPWGQWLHHRVAEQRHTYHACRCLGFRF
ncbi:MAG: glycosyltransferase family 2 protein [Magnetococcus sp. DMHC-1]|nr:glycosyltransferase family 2 protein [Magnetococcales bacterium]